MRLPRLKEWRERRALTQAELGELTGMAQEAISRIESGVRGCQPRTARKLSKALDVDVAELAPPPEVPSDPKSLVPKRIRRSLEREGVRTAWALSDDEEVLAEGERLGNEAMQKELIPALRIEQQALRRIAANPDLPLEDRDHADLLAEEIFHRMIGLLKEARKRARTPEDREKIAETRRELLADAS